MNDHAGEDARGLAALGTAIRMLRTRAGLSEEDLSARAEVELSLIEAVEEGRQEPTWGDLRRIAYGLDTPLEKLLELVADLEGEAGSEPG
jgi:transcriptional regulator with XRE-family HTH domain